MIDIKSLRCEYWMTLVLSLLFFCLSGCAHAHKTQRVYLSGLDRDHTVQWDFYCTKGRKSGQWTKIKVPSNWELQGFGNYDYGHVKQKHDETGKYKYQFEAPASFKDKTVRIVFEGVMTDTQVWVNGKSAGDKHQGGFYRFKYDITDNIKYSQENLLEVTVNKVSSNLSIEQAERKADYWVFGGIYRPVYLEIMPKEFIDWTAIDAKADGSFLGKVYCQEVKAVDKVLAQISTLDGKMLGKPFEATMNENMATLKTKITGHKLWSSETPNLYKVEIQLKRGDQIVHQVTERFGFRTFEIKEKDGLYLNGQKIVLKGVNRHSFRPDSGRCLSQSDCHEDVTLIKEMNMNAVRMSHYPPDKVFLDLCDQLGLYVLNELAGWQKPSYDTTVGKKLVKEMVTRDVNHPSILFWDNANEGGWNEDLDVEFSKYDPQDRPVLHPWALFSGIDTGHYRSYAGTKDRLSKNIFLPTEFLHGLYDGGMGAGLNDYWNLMKNHPNGAGGFLWVMADEGVVRTDKNGMIDTDGNHAPDGMVGPYHEKEGSYYTIKQIWSPVQIDIETIPEDFDGRIEVENGYDFINLDQCLFKWELVKYAGPDDKELLRLIDGGMIENVSVKPRQKGMLNLQLPNDWKKADALYLTAVDYNNRDLWTWTLPVIKPVDIYADLSLGNSGTLKAGEFDETVVVSSAKMKYTFCLSNAMLLSVENQGRTFSFNNGPRVVPASDKEVVSDNSVRHYLKENAYVIESLANNGLDQYSWKVYPNGMLELDYRYSKKGQFDYLGITFDYPEEKVISKKWLGGGPYRVWKNRMKGTGIGVWDVAYNDAEPGVLWVYPEFKGYFSDMYWVRFVTEEGEMTVYTETEDLFLRVFTPKAGKEPRNTSLAFPAGDISFLHKINGIGTKFKKAEQLGPESQKNNVDGTFSGKLRFIFD